MIYLPILLLLRLTAASFVLESTRPKGHSSKVCLSNTSSSKILERYWDNLEQGMPNGPRMCSIGSGESHLTSGANIKKLIRDVRDSPTALNVSCVVANQPEHSISIAFLEIPDDFIKPTSIDCVTGESIREVGTLDEAASPPDFHKPVIIEMDEDTDFLPPRVLPASNDIRPVTLDTRHGHITRDEEKIALQLEVDTLRDQLGVERRQIAELNSIMQNTANMADSEREQNQKTISEKHRQIHDQTRQIHELEREIMRLSRPTTLPLLKTTLAVMTAVSLLPASDAVLWPHTRNRIGSGLYKMSDDDSVDCRPVNYLEGCYGFELLLDSSQYPFFSSHSTFRSLLEAVNDNIVNKNNEGICLSNSSQKDPKCHSDKALMQAYCPNNFRSAHYIDDNGQLRGVVCKEGYEITEDCNFCRKIKKSANQNKDVYKSSVQMQDIVCQPGGEAYDGPKIRPKGACFIGNRVFKKCKLMSKSYEVVPFVTVPSKGKIYLDTMILKNEEVISEDSFVCYDHRGQEGGSVATEQESRGLNAVRVSECKIVNSAKTKKCSGDAVFCSKYKCANEYPEVYCRHVPGAGNLKVLMSGQWIKPTCLGYEKVLVGREQKLNAIQPQEECNTCNVKCLNDGIRIRSTGFKMYTAVACAHGSCKTITQKPSSEILVPYPGITASSGGKIGITLSHDDSKVSAHLTAHCKGRDPCEVYSCFFCWENFLNYQCHNVLSALVSTMIIISLLWVSLSIIVKILRRVKLIPSYVKNPLAWMIYLWTWTVRSLLAYFRRKIYSLNHQIGWNGDIEMGENRPRRRVDNPLGLRNLVPLQRYSLLFMFLVMTVSADACSQSVVASSKIVRCRVESSKTVCKVSGSVVLKAGVIGSDSCLIIKGSSEGQKALMTVRTISSELVCREGQSFWTGQFTPSCLSSRRCHLVGECVEKDCQSWRDNVTSGEFGALGDNEMMTENKCFEQCGGLGCSCWNINPSCLFVHTKLVSTRKEAVRVFSCSEWVHRVTLEITTPKKEKDTVILTNLGSKFLSWGSISLSIDAEAITGSNSYTFLQSTTGGFALLDEGLQTIPREGYLGEIRCSSEAAVINGHKSCLRAPNLVKYKPMTDIVECTTSLVDPFAVFLRGSLPQMREGMTFTSTKDKKSVQAMSSYAIKAEINLLLDDYDVEFAEDVVNCEASFVNISGCYSCNLGALICLTIKSPREGTFSSHNSDSTLVLATHTSAGTQDYCMMTHFNTPHVEEELTYSCGGDEKKIEITGTLIAMLPYDDRNTTGGDSTVVNPASSSWSFLEWFKGLFSWLGGPLKGFFVIAGYVIASIILIILILMVLRFLVARLMAVILKKTK
ncbi:glycoprotein [Rio Claro virus]|uniref:Envelopment polyprotein n=1 Tax=Rio Claro virus TaxID=2848418 RepID=I1T369_9VIRU|nr:glycoprotein [Rio Claro virus]AEL29686.1 glycoprotein [Rio Claro virus]